MICLQILLTQNLKYNCFCRWAKIKRIELIQLLLPEISEKEYYPGKRKRYPGMFDFPQGIQGKQIQFIVNAQEANSKNNNKWIYIASGSLILAAGAVLGYVFLTPGGDTGLPLPPSRPANN